MAEPRSGLRAVAVYCGSSPGDDPAYLAAAADCGAALANAGLRVVYGGGRNGLMGAVADAALAAGGEVIGVMPGHLIDREVDHHGLSALHRVDTLHQRKARMAELADGFVALPGGIGTLEEIAEVLCWQQLGLHAKPCVLVNVNGYYDPLLAFLARAGERGFVPPARLGELRVVTRVETLLAALTRSSAAIV